MILFYLLTKKQLAYLDFMLISLSSKLSIPLSFEIITWIQVKQIVKQLSIRRTNKDDLKYFLVQENHLEKQVDLYIWKINENNPYILALLHMRVKFEYFA